MKQEDIGAAFWDDKDGWRGWSFNDDMNRYFFNDIPEYGFVQASVQLEAMEGLIKLD